jgi:hypothetical protein
MNNWKKLLCLIWHDWRFDHDSDFGHIQTEECARCGKRRSFWSYWY